MRRFYLDANFEADCVIGEKSRSGEIYHVRRNAIGSGKLLTPVARYFAWQPEFVEGSNRHWRIDCFVMPKPMAPPEPIALGRVLVTALVREELCNEPIWLSSWRSDDEKGQAYGKVFEDEAFEDE